MTNLPPEAPRRAGEEVSERWVEWRRSVDLEKYDRRWDERARRGESIHGEIDAVERLVAEHFTTSSVTLLDAGCGTGRLAIEARARGHRTVGVDLDADMITRARLKAPELEWHVSDLATFDHHDRFDVIVLAGNIFLFCRPDAHASIVRNLARLLAPDGLLVAGWSQESDPNAYRADRFVADGEANGLVLERAWRDWDGNRFTDDADYAVVVLTNSARPDGGR